MATTGGVKLTIMRQEGHEGPLKASIEPSLLVIPKPVLPARNLIVDGGETADFSRDSSRVGVTILWGISNGLLLLCECAGVEFHDFAHMRQEISQAMVAGIQVILVLHTFRLELPM